MGVNIGYFLPILPLPNFIPQQQIMLYGIFKVQLHSEQPYHRYYITEPFTCTQK